MNRPLNRRMISLSIMAATVMQTLDSTIANVALPHMQGALSASQDQVAWVLTAYIVAAAVAMPLTGWLVDQFGQRSVFLISVIGFTAASTLCGLSDSLPQMIVARLLQGVCGAALVPLSQMVLMDINPPDKQGPALALWGMGVTAGPILGPTLGGWLTESYSWRFVFFINIPIGVLAGYGIWRYIEPTTPARRMQFDTFGFASLSITVGALQLLLDRGQQNDWFSSIETCIEAILMIMSLTCFVAHTALTPADKSFFDHRLLRNANYVSGLVFIFIVGLVLFASRALTPTLLEDLFDYPATTTGLLTAPSGLGAMAAMFLAGRLIGKVDVRLSLLFGFLVTIIALWQMTQYSLSLAPADIVWPGVIQGLGTGLVFVPLSSAAFATLNPAVRAAGTATFSLARNIGSSVGISMVQTMLVRNTVAAHARLVEHIVYANPAWNNPALAAAYDVSKPAGAAALDAAILLQSSMIAYIDDFRLMLYLTIAVLPLLFLVRKPPASQAAAEAHALMD